MRPRICWLSNSPMTMSGYGVQTALFVPRIKALGYDIVVHAFYGQESSIVNWNGIQIFPRHVEAYGQDIVGAHAQASGSNVIITLIDAWVMQPNEYMGIPWVPWLPIDHEPAPPAVVDKLKQALVPIAYSKFGLREMQNAGLEPLYVPHGVDSKVFAPMDRQEARKKLGWPQDRFIVGMVAANKGWTPVRKSFFEQIAAFARLKKKHPDALLYLHTNVDAPDAWQTCKLTPIMEYCGLKPQEDVFWVSQYHYFVGAVPFEQMAAIYSGLDVLTNVSRGEGFGVPILEAQACGTPVVVGGWTSMPELCFAGWQVPRDNADVDWTPQNAAMWKPRVNAIAERYEWAYRQAGDEKLRTQARAGAVEYDADLVVEKYWAPALVELERRLSEPQLVAGPVGRAA